jgi:dTDP-4-dehydrorhamnose 3,5-epimerase
MSEWIDGVFGCPLTTNEDARGSLMELFRNDILSMYNISPAMGYISWTKPNIGRGPHEHVDQTDVFAFIGPATFKLYLWDNKEKSPTAGNKIVMDVGKDNPTLWIVPPGVVHGYKNISAIDGMVLNFPNQLYRGKGRMGNIDEIRHEEDKDGKFVME